MKVRESLQNDAIYRRRGDSREANTRATFTRFLTVISLNGESQDVVIDVYDNQRVEGAGERFEEVEKMLLAAKRHLGDELHDKYRITLDDMKPEYVA